MENALQIEGLTKQYKGFSLQDVTFCIPQGTVMGLIGPNGAGKTTVIKCIMNLVRKDTGEIRVFGMDPVRHGARIKERIGFVYDMPCQFGDVRLGRIASALGPFYPEWDEKRFRDLAGKFELPLEKVYKKLSHGTKTKFSLALALAHNADLVLMDEPTSGLDPVFRRDLLGLLAEILQDERKSILFSTHITSDLERIADFVTLLQNGAVVFSSPKDEILESWGMIKGGEELKPASEWPEIRGIRTGAFGVEVLTSDTGKSRKRLGPKILIERPSFDDIVTFTHQGGKHAC